MDAGSEVIGASGDQQAECADWSDPADGSADYPGQAGARRQQQAGDGAPSGVGQARAVRSH